MGEPIIDMLAQEWAAIDSFAATVAENEWGKATALPGWSVQDNLSHIVGTELMLLGETPPAVDTSHLTHVVNTFSASMEGWVEARRSRTGDEVLAEYREVIPRRLEVLRAMTDDELAALGWSPIGEVPYRDFMVVRVFDCWMHEQDMRRALGRPGHLDGPVVDLALTRFEAALGFIVGKRAAAADGESVVFAVTGQTERRYAVVVDGRARLVDTSPTAPTTTITLPLTSFVALGGGRWTHEEALTAGGLTAVGNEDLAKRVLEGMAFTP